MLASSTLPPVVRMEQVYKFHYTDELQTAAVNGIDLSIHPGEFVAIMGPSGSGKSTLLNLIGLIDDLSKGKYWFNGQEVSQLSRNAKAQLRKGNIGFIFQSFNLIDELTAAENIELPLLYLRLPAKERRTRVSEALAALDMEHRKQHYPQQLSGGQQQRIAIARAMVTRPAIILADEPTGNLDSENSAIVMEKLQYFHQEGATIVMVTHSEEDAAQAQRTIELFDGKQLISEHEYKQQSK
ncbi:MAG: ABC transporter ATP-binding protein [Bacteroidota bacterium]